MLTDSQVTSKIADSASLQSTPVRSLYAADEDFQELLEYFVGALPERRMQLLANLEEGDVAMLKGIAHQLKGAGGGYGYPGLTDVAHRLETICKAGHTREVPAAVQSLIDYMERICL
ncbi:Hpt domain-containing protein [Rubinisphaera margarita]|uniref:Hpt domain-containing protein n=1 Tax=Rubinisphaera margarita TaxID=2909586 RepID=UPI001EE82B5A|nr:Hpt domain-containing protein [Rubinisphaera margarita]MCG6154761.1 Hpt domain-containing protein [Rubinisphaera margarita]